MLFVHFCSQPTSGQGGIGSGDAGAGSGTPDPAPSSPDPAQAAPLITLSRSARKTGQRPVPRLYARFLTSFFGPLGPKKRVFGLQSSPKTGSKTALFRPFSAEKDVFSGQSRLLLARKAGFFWPKKPAFWPKEPALAGKAGFWPKEPAFGRRSRLLPEEAGFWPKKPAFGQKSRFQGPAPRCGRAGMGFSPDQTGSPVWSGLKPIPDLLAFRGRPLDAGGLGWL